MNKIVDLKLPLPWLLSTAFAIVTALAGMYFQLNQLREDMADLKIAVRSGNNATTSLSESIAVLKFRVENLENRRDHK